MKSLWKTAICFGLLSAGCLALAPLSADPLPRARSFSEIEALRAMARTRIGEALERGARRPVQPAAVDADARRLAGSLTEPQLRAIAAGEDVESVLGGSLRLATSQALGDSRSDLLFVPLNPCRIVDTRKPSPGSKIAPGETRHFQVAGTSEFHPQGGNLGGCGVPPGVAEPAAAAVALNFVAIRPEGTGHMRAWSYDQPMPLASIINYDLLAPFFNIANGVIVPIAGTSTDFDLSVRADFNAAHLVADVTGYFTRFPLESFQSSEKSITVVKDAGVVDLSSTDCTEVSSCTITSGAAGKVIVRAWAQIQLDHGTNVGGDRIAVGVKNDDPTNCTNNDQSIHATDYEVPDALPAENDIDWTLSHKRIFNQSKGTKTYFINARMITGGGPGDVIQTSRMICTFIPD
ncbi:MAG TPA: hypothetical protein VNW71_11585 [Thermoanaerobaculia bacterium]|nr:hypothetical protein [Thermoanaerobaculia bacterium]